MPSPIRTDNGTKLEESKLVKHSPLLTEEQLEEIERLEEGQLSDEDFQRFLRISGLTY